MKDTHMSWTPEIEAEYDRKVAEAEAKMQADYDHRFYESKLKPEHAKRRIYMREWRAKNRDHYNKLMQAHRNRQREKRILQRNACVTRLMEED